MPLTSAEIDRLMADPEIDILVRSHPFYRDHLAGPEGEYWAGRLLRRAHGGGVVRASPPITRVLGKVNVGFFHPVSAGGGAERVSEDIAQGLDPERFHVTGRVVYADGPEAPGNLAVASDVIVTWGIPDFDVQLKGHPRVILAAHGQGQEDRESDFRRWAVESVGRASEARSLVAVGENCVGAFPQDQRHRVRVIPNMVDPARVVAHPGDRGRMRRSWGVPPDAWVVLYLGRVMPEKRPEAAIHAAEAGRDVWVVMCGAGEAEAGVRAILEEARGVGLNWPRRVVLAGYTHEVGAALGAADVLLLPSETEGCSLTGLEAHLAGLPVIATAEGLYAVHPELARLLDAPTASQVARAVRQDRQDPSRQDRARWAKEYVQRVHNPDAFHLAWASAILAIAPAPRLGVGGHLSKQLARWGFLATPDCPCREIARQMDELGPDGCEGELDRLVEVLAQNARDGKFTLAQPTRNRVGVRRRAAGLGIVGLVQGDRMGVHLLQGQVRRQIVRAIGRARADLDRP